MMIKPVVAVNEEEGRIMINREIKNILQLKNTIQIIKSQIMKWYGHTHRKYLRNTFGPAAC